MYANALLVTLNSRKIVRDVGLGKGKNQRDSNSFKLSKYAVQSLLAGAEVIKIGCVMSVASVVDAC